MTDRFRWHPKARLFHGLGRELSALPPSGPLAKDSPHGLAQVIGLPAFRIGALYLPAPVPARVPVFETLTSGSTGRPRRILRTQQSWIDSFQVNAGFGIGPLTPVAVLGPLVYSLSLYGAIEGLHLGATVHLLGGLRPNVQCKALAEHNISHLYASPAQLRFLVARHLPCPALQLILVGGSKLDPTLRAALREMAPNAQVREFYGAAEASFITLADEDTPEGSVGRAYPGVELKVDPAGEIWVKSPYLFLGYADASTTEADRELPSPLVGEGEGGGATGKTPPTPILSPRGGGEARVPVGSARWNDGWLSVGEIGRLEDGFLYLHGRAGRMVTVADQNVFPEEVEALMQTLPGIARVAVLPVPDARRGRVLVALVHGDPVQEAAILTALRAELGPLKSPKALIWQTDWPLLPSGKTDLRALEARLRWPA